MSVPRSVVIGTLLFGLLAGAHGEGGSMSESQAQFATVLGLPASAVRSLDTIALPHAGPLRALMLGVADTADGPAAMLVPVTTLGGGTPLPLGPASSIPFALVLDLALPATIDLRGAGTRPASATAPQRPALLVRSRVTSDGEQRDQLSLISLETMPQLLWQAPVARIGADGSGFDSLELTIAKAGHGWPRLALLQNALPAEGAADFMPGPPLVLEYRWKGKGYQRVD